MSDELSMHSYYDLLGIFEVVATVGGIQTLQGEIAASLARRLSVAFDLAPLALIAASPC
jgi:hypothetical protein